MNIEVCEDFTKAKFALTSVQKWPYRSGIIDLYNKNKFKRLSQ
jgi:hypothetical protein